MCHPMCQKKSFGTNTHSLEVAYYVCIERRNRQAKSDLQVVRDLKTLGTKTQKSYQLSQVET